MITSVIFDMDGVLIDSQPIHFKSDILTIKNYGVVVTQKDLEKFAGTTNKTRFQLYKDEFNIHANIDEMIILRDKITMELFKQYPLVAIDGIKNLLIDLKGKGIKTAVASSSGYELIYTVLDKIGISQYYDKILSGEDVKNGKPEPDVFLGAAKLLDSLPKECVVIEDSTNGVIAGVSAGMKVIGYKNITSGNQDLSKANVIINNFNDINADFILKL